MSQLQEQRFTMLEQAKLKSIALVKKMPNIRKQDLQELIGLQLLAVELFSKESFLCEFPEMEVAINEHEKTLQTLTNFYEEKF